MCGQSRFRRGCAGVIAAPDAPMPDLTTRWSKNESLTRPHDNGAMIPMKHSTIFKSRWMALLWAGGILWVAYDVATSAKEQEDASNGVATANQAADDVTANDVKALADSLNSL
jgi:hypothetical protein